MYVGTYSYSFRTEDLSDNVAITDRRWIFRIPQRALVFALFLTTVGFYRSLDFSPSTFLDIITSHESYCCCQIEFDWPVGLVVRDPDC